MDDWAPTVNDVGSLLRARTRDSGGNELGTFTAQTRPTGDQVIGLITQAVSDVTDAIGQTIPPDLYDNAAKLAALGTALYIELGFFPEQIGTGRSPYPQLKQLYDDRLKRLVQSVESEGADTPGTEYMSPAGAFGGPPIPTNWWQPW